MSEDFGVSSLPQEIKSKLNRTQISIGRLLSLTEFILENSGNDK